MTLCRKPTAADIPAILEIINEARLFLKECGVDQWQSDFPNAALIEEDIATRSPFVLEASGIVAGYFCLAYGIDPTYVTPVRGAFTISGGYATIHRSAISNAFRGQGLSKMLFAAAEEDCAKNGIHVLRIDTHKDNSRMRHIIQKNGFSECAVIRIADGSLRIAYEKEVGYR